MNENDSTSAKGDDVHDIPETIAAPVPIVDTDGVSVNGRSFYKLLMSDGTELGMTSHPVLGWLADESPSNGGAIIQISKTSPLPDIAAVWNDGDLAYVRGASFEAGSLVKRYLCVFPGPGGGALVHVGWTNIVARATRFQAVRVAGTRVSWHAEFRQSRLGIRLDKGVLEADPSSLRLPLACQFERVESLPGDITI